nr:hypothetical protein [Micromonospora provocatoris]
MSGGQAPSPGASAPTSPDAREAGTTGRPAGGRLVAGSGGPAAAPESAALSPRVAADHTSCSGAG